MKKTALSKALAIVGTMLVCFPVAFTIVTSVAGTIAEGRMRFDYLMPAELFLVVLAGGLLLLWAALLTRQFRKSVIIGFAVACVLLVASQLIAVASGLASGAVPPEGPVFVLVIAMLAAYTAAVIWLDVTGILLTRRLLKKQA